MKFLTHIGTAHRQTSHSNLNLWFASMSPDRKIFNVGYIVAKNINPPFPRGVVFCVLFSRLGYMYLLSVKKVNTNQILGNYYSGVNKVSPYLPTYCTYPSNPTVC